MTRPMGVHYITYHVSVTNSSHVQLWRIYTVRTSSWLFIQ